MFFTRIIFTLLSISATVLCANNELCDFSDEDCVTNANKLVIKLIITGNQSWGLNSLEPLHVETININLSNNMNYILTDVYLSRMIDCDVKKLKFDEEMFSWYFYLICPRLILKADYVENGLVDSVSIKGKGKIVITYDNYHIVTKGEFETVTGRDGKPHLNITNYKIDLLDVKDNVVHEFINVSSNDLEKSERVHKHFNDNWQKVTDEIQYTVLQQPVDQLMNNINQYVVAVPKYEIFYKDP